MVLTEKVREVSFSPEASKRKIDTVLLNESAVKRQKNTHSTYKKHPDFWISDGNFLLQLGDVRFKLHRSRLAAHSGFFEKLFEEGAGENQVDVEGAGAYPGLANVKVERVDELLLYHLQPATVSLADFQALLRAMDNGISYHHGVLSFPKLAAILRASDSLHFPLFRDYAAKTLETIFSDNLDHLSTEQIPYAAQAVVLGRRWNLPRILKRAFYELARTPVLCDEDPNSYASEDDRDGEMHLGIYSLTSEDLVRLLNVQKKLGLKWDVSTLLEPCKCSGGRNLDNACPSSRADRNRTFIYKSPSPPEKFKFDPLCGMQALSLLDWKGKAGYCEMCEMFRKNSLKRQMEKIWDDMDAWLGLN